MEGYFGVVRLISTQRPINLLLFLKPLIIYVDCQVTFRFTT